MRAVTFHISTIRWFLCQALGRFRKSTYWGRLSTVRLKDIPPQPLPGPDWVRVRPRLGGICGTDLGHILLQNPPDVFTKGLAVEPIVLGHENVGVVIERGPAAEDVPEGLRVNVDPMIACAARGLDPCPSCRDGQLCACWNAGRTDPKLGLSLGHSAVVGGTWSDSFVAHKSQLVPVPENLTDDHAVLVDPLSCSVHTVLRRPPTPADQDVLVIGSGIIGLGIIDFLRAWGFKGRLLAIVAHRFQKNLALHFGADEVWDRGDLRERDLIQRVADRYHLQTIKGSYGKKIVLGGVDVIYDAIGNRASVEDSIRIVRPQGTIVIAGMGHPRWVDWDPVVHKQITILGSHGRGIEFWKGARPHTYRVVHDLMAAGRFPAARLLTHTFPLEDYATAFDILAHKGKHAAVHAAFRIST
jgi:threonine dehydrogenase-like Zn-dependent dehydrogenase